MTRTKARKPKAPTTPVVVFHTSAKQMLTEAIAENRANGDHEMADRQQHLLDTKYRVAMPTPMHDDGTDRPQGNGHGNSRAYAKRLMTEKQRGMIQWLLTKVPADVAAKARPWFEERIDSLTAAQASDVITRLKGHRDTAPEAPETPVEATTTERRTFRPITLADGYYAIVTDGKTHFYRVSTYKKGNQDRRKVQEQASDTLHYVRWYNALHIQDLIIEFGVEKSQKLYASELGQCFICGRTLTDDDSRALGVGPTCRKKL